MVHRIQVPHETVVLRKMKINPMEEEILLSTNHSTPIR